MGNLADAPKRVNVLCVHVPTQIICSHLKGKNNVMYQNVLLPVSVSSGTYNIPDLASPSHNPQHHTSTPIIGTQNSISNMNLKILLKKTHNKNILSI